MRSAATAKWATLREVSSTIEGLASERPILLSWPDRSGGRPIMQLLAWQRSPESIESAALTHERLSDLLWAASGVTHPKGFVVSRIRSMGLLILTEMQVPSARSMPV